MQMICKNSFCHFLMRDLLSFFITGLRDSIEGTDNEFGVIEDNFETMDQYLETNADLLSSLVCCL